MQTEMTALHQRLKTTMISVTHDQIEAMAMPVKIVVLRGGRVELLEPRGATAFLYCTLPSGEKLAARPEA